MKQIIAMLLSVFLLLLLSACSSVWPETQTPAMPTEPITSEQEETISAPATELPEQPKEEESMKQAQFYITANDLAFSANFAESGSADAFRALLQDGDLTIQMRDYGGFEKVGSLGTSLPRQDTQISTATGDVMLYQGDQIVLFYGTNSWSYSPLGKMEGVTAEALLSAFGSGDVAITFSLTAPQQTTERRNTLEHSCIERQPKAERQYGAMVSAFAEGARESGHTVKIVNVCQKKIAGCLACEYCHTKGNGQCIQQDDMQDVYPLLQEAEMIVLASPIYYHSFTGQLQCAINRIYALDKPKNLKKAALILSSGSDHVYSGAIFEYQNSFLQYLHLEDMGIFSAHGKENQSEEKLKELREFGRKLQSEGSLA